MSEGLNPDILEIFFHEPPKTLAVAVSGGVDSMALLYVANAYCCKHLIPLVAITVDHGLRPDSGREAQQVTTWCQAMGIDHHIVRWQGEKPQTRIQEHARQARYDLIKEWMNERDHGTLLTAHHKDDQLETVLMRLLAGSGLDGLAGMKERVLLESGVELCRPLLTISRSEIEQFAADHSISHVNDPSNLKSDYQRNRVRQFLNQEDTRRASSTLAKLAQDADFIQNHVGAFVSDHVIVDPVGWIRVPLEKIRSVHRAIALRVLSRILSTYQSYPMSYEKLCGLWDKINQESFSSMTLAGFYIYVWRGQLCFQRELRCLKDTPLKGEFIWDKRFAIHAGHSLDKYHVSALGENALAEIKDKMSHYTYPNILWPTLPAVYLEGTVVAVPQLGYSNQSHIQWDQVIQPIFKL